MARKFDYSPDKLIKAWRAHRLADQFGRDRRREMVRQYVGNHWSQEGTSEDRPLNLISLVVQTYSRQLIPKNPRFMATTHDRANKAQTAAFQDWGNCEIERMDLKTTIRRVVTDALFGLGIARVALTTPAESAAKGWGPKAGQPMVSRIDREDFAWDSFAGDFGECAWMAHQFRVPLAVVKESKQYSARRKDLVASRPQPYDEIGVEKIHVLGSSFYGIDEVEDMVDLIEFYCPRHRSIVTMYLDAGGSPSLCPDGKPLGEQPWVGPECGPYYPLGYQWVPGNPLFKGIIQDAFDLDQATNQSLRKAIATAEGIKELTLFQDAEDAARIAKANDGATEFCQNPQNVQQVVFRGQTLNAVLGHADIMRDLFNFVTNVEVLGGRGPQAKTLGQEEIINQNAGGGMQDMQETTINRVGDLLEGLGWYWWKHPHKVMEAPFSPRGLPEMSVVRQLHPKGAMDRNGRPHLLRRDMPWEKLGVRIVPYSLAPQTPQGRLAFLNAMLDRFMPLMPILQQQGITLDLNFLMQKYAEYGDEPDVMDMWTVRDAPEPDQASELPHTQTLPTNTQRTYNRVNTSEKTSQGQTRSRAAQLLSGKSQGGYGGAA